MGLEKVTTTHLFLVRHGQTAQSHDDAFCGTTETPLTAKGHEQALHLSERLRYEPISALYCSPQGRACETATPIADALGVKIQTRNALREMDFGRWENRARNELAQEYPQELATWEHGSWMAQPPDGETQQAVIARIVPCITELLTFHAGQTILIVSHKTILRLFIGHVLNMSLPDSRSLKMSAGSISELSVTGDRVQLMRINDTSYLAP